MKHMKRIIAILVAALLLFSLAACGGDSETSPRTPVPVEYNGEKISVTLSGTAADYGLCKLLDNETYSVSTSDELLGDLSDDLAVMPLWHASELGSSGSSLNILAITTFGQLSLVTNGAEISGVKDLDGKQISVGQAYPVSSDSYSRVFDQSAKTVERLLDVYGVKATVETEPLQNVYDKIVAGSTPIAVLPEPFASLAAAKSGAKIAFTLTNAWSESDETSLMAEYCVVAKDSFVESNPQGVEKFLADLRASVEWVNLHPTDAVNLLIEKGLVDADVLHTDPELADRKAEAAKNQQAVDLIARANVVVIEGEAMKAAVAQNDLLQVENLDSLLYISN